MGLQSSFNLTAFLPNKVNALILVLELDLPEENIDNILD